MRALPRLVWIGLLVAAGAPVAAQEASSVRQEIFRRLSEGRAEFELGDFKSAAEDLCWASHRALNSHDAAWFCGRALLRLRNPDGALKALRIATDIDPKHLGSWIDLGNALLASGRPAEARPAFYKALDIRKDYSPAWDGLARLAQQTGNEKEALDLFGKALEANPADARARLHRGELHLAAGRLDQAIADISEAARLRPDDGDVQLGLARVQLRAHQTDEALAAVRRAGAVLKKDPRVPALTSEIFLAVGALAEAEDSARTALAIDPDQGRARLVLGEVLGRRGQLDEALTVLAPHDPQLLEESELTDLQAARARWQARKDELSRLETVAARPDAPFDALAQLADVRLETGDRDGAAVLAERAAPLATNAAMVRRVAVLLGRAGRPTAAAERLGTLAAQGQAGSTDMLNLGVLREQTGDADGAADAYRNALTTKDPRVAGEAHAGLARLALARGDRAEMAAQLKAYLETDPPPELASRARAALARVEPDTATAKTNSNPPSTGSTAPASGPRKQ